ASRNIPTALPPYRRTAIDYDSIIRVEESMTVSTASAVWEGGLKGGKGNFSAASGAFKGPYTYASRFEGAKGTTPEELIAAAHASCLSMAISAGLEHGGTPPTRIAAKASCTLEMVGGGPKITKMRLEVRGKV